MRTALCALSMALCLAPAAMAGRGPIVGEPVGLTLTGCGEVVQSDTCGKLFEFYEYPNLGLFTIGDLSAYQPGTALYVEGQVCLNCLLVDCGQPYAALSTWLVTECIDVGPGGRGFVYVDECLTVVDGGPCGVLLQNADGGLYMAAEDPGFLAGASIHVVGTSPVATVAFCADLSAAYPLLTVDSVSGCPGDFDVSGFVDGADLGELLGSWGECDGCDADMNGDGVVDGADLGLLLALWS